MIQKYFPEDISDLFSDGEKLKEFYNVKRTKIFKAYQTSYWNNNT